MSFSASKRPIAQVSSAQLAIDSIAKLPVCLFACLPVCLFACLPVCLFAVRLRRDDTLTLGQRIHCGTSAGKPLATQH